MNENAQEALYWMKHLGDEFEYIGTSPLQGKFKIILLMVYVDIFSQIWCDFIKKNPIHGKQKKRFSSWLNEFVFCEKNSYFRDQIGEFHLLNGDVFYQIRNSLLHFGGLPSLSGILVFISTDTREEFCKKYSHKIREREVLILCPKVLFVAVAIGIANTIERIVSRYSDRKEQDNILSNIYERVRNEIALPIDVGK